MAEPYLTTERKEGCLVPTIKRTPPEIVTTDGAFLIPLELIDALARFMTGKKPAGMIELTFRNGGVAGIECRERLK